MNLKDFSGLLLACVAGFLGGLSSAGHRLGAPTVNIVRATSFEVVNASGVPVGRWQVGADNTLRLSFLSNRGNESLQVGVLGDGRPYLRMAGHDGKDRIVVELDLADKPMLSMGDERWEGRVHMGFLPPDAFPYSDWDNWGLSFRGIGSERSVAAIGMLKKEANRMEGFLTVSGKSIR